MTHELRLLILQLFNLTLSIIGVVYVYMTQEWHWLLVAFGMYVTVCLFGNSIAYHRLLSHRSFDTYRPIRAFLVFMGVLTCAGSPISWVSTHRYHHRTADTPNDPHSPENLGMVKGSLGPFVWNYENVSAKFAKDLLRDPQTRFAHRHYFKIILTYAAILALIDLRLLLFVYAIPSFLVPAVLSFSLMWTHRVGYRTHNTPDTSTNSPMTSWLLWGEGWHNNHHAHPSAWSNWEKWWEVDVPAIVIWCIKKK